LAMDERTDVGTLDRGAGIRLWVSLRRVFT